MDNDPESTEFKEHFRARLIAEREALAVESKESEDSRKPVELDQQSVGRLSRMDAMQGQAMAAASEARRKQRAALVEAALRRLDDGDYGYCIDCGEPIGIKRLEVDPVFPRCVRCA
ncbi:TraR/DksA family transcriptional regulator [Pelagibacterium halotolerans]|uniref:TraR/DksA family transcriptional regulator n=1 Tax=Pelagibacterium halotolerans TaxID=531813 RepID=UPI00384BB86A